MPEATTPTRARERIRIGPAGFSYADWNGRVYPPGIPRGFDRLGWMARFFDLIEINVSFYRVPAPEMAARWTDKVRDRTDFLFTVKLHRSLTHERNVDPAVVEGMIEFLTPLAEAERLGPLLAQFPWSFRPTEANLDHLRRLREAFAAFPLAVEVRHGAWGRDERLEMLASLDVTPVRVDQPRIGDSLGPIEIQPRDVAYVRLHGRNHAAWFDPKAGRDARYDYLYGPHELKEWTGRIEEIARAAREVHVVTNNHFRGQAVANALELKARLGQPVPEIPAWLEEAVPGLLERLRAEGATPTEVDAREAASEERGGREPNPRSGDGREPDGESGPDSSPPAQGNLFA
jgi:uncharacterized protein YecE (DUF72 family)